MALDEILSDVRDTLRDFYFDDSIEKDEFQIAYIKLFTTIWKEGAIYYQKKGIEPPPAEHESKEEEQMVTEEMLEEADIRHEAALMTVSRKRKEYPERIAAFLGKRRRLQKNSAEVMKVELPPRIPIELADEVYDMSDRMDMESGPSNSLSESIKQLQPNVQRLDNLADAAGLLKNIQKDPHGESPKSKSL